MHYPMSCLPRDPLIDVGTVRGQITAPELTERHTPAYPPVARKAGMQAKVIVHTVIRADGTTGEACVLYDGHPGWGFDDAALTSVKKWRYRPARLDGEAVPVYFTVIVQFRQ